MTQIMRTTIAHKEKAAQWAALLSDQSRDLTLAGFETWLCLVDYIDAALTAHDAAIAVTALERAERVTDLHGLLLISRRASAWVGGWFQTEPANSWWAILGSNQ